MVSDKNTLTTNRTVFFLTIAVLNCHLIMISWLLFFVSLFVLHLILSIKNEFILLILIKEYN